MRNPEVEARWTSLRDAILLDVDVADVVVRVPRGQPTSLDDGLRWVQLSVYEGWYIAYLVDRSTQPATLWFKIWEFGEEEPTWEEVRATPIDPPRPENELW